MNLFFRLLSETVNTPIIQFLPCSVILRKTCLNCFNCSYVSSQSMVVVSMVIFTYDLLSLLWMIEYNILLHRSFSASNFDNSGDILFHGDRLHLLGNCTTDNRSRRKRLLRTFCDPHKPGVTIGCDLSICLPNSFNIAIRGSDSHFCSSPVI